MSATLIEVSSRTIEKIRALQPGEQIAICVATNGLDVGQVVDLSDDSTGEKTACKVVWVWGDWLVKIEVLP